MESFIDKILSPYRERYASENARLSDLYRFAQTHLDWPELTSRGNMDGHLTVGGLIVNQQHSHVLLINHITLEKRLPPGGHIESEDACPIQSIQREIEEEVGIESEKLTNLRLAESNPLVPFDINTHWIPSNPRKSEGRHQHHDLRYVFELNHNAGFPRFSPEVLRGESELPVLEEIEANKAGIVDWYEIGTAFPGEEQDYLASKLQAFLTTC